MNTILKLSLSLILIGIFSGVYSQGEKPRGFAGDAENLVFRIQIAASVEPLDLNTLRKIYPTATNITNEKDGIWYKYSIGNYPTYKEAWQAQKEMKVKGSFIVAYRKGERIKNIREVAQPLD